MHFMTLKHEYQQHCLHDIRSAPQICSEKLQRLREASQHLRPSDRITDFSEIDYWLSDMSALLSKVSQILIIFPLSLFSIKAVRHVFIPGISLFVPKYAAHVKFRFGSLSPSLSPSLSLLFSLSLFTFFFALGFTSSKLMTATTLGDLFIFLGSNICLLCRI